MRKLARRIELLAPAVDAAGRHPANCEYPWENPNGEIIAPMEHNFGFEALYERGGRHLMKLLRTAAADLVEPGEILPHA